ncbi:MAG: hypothetical protein AAGC54_08175, partial [Cyanobacteria bacterium P01_F01_bin.4]
NLRGVVSVHTQERWDRIVNDAVGNGLRNRWKEVVDDTTSKKPKVDWDGLRSRLEEELRRVIRRELPKRYPLIVVLLQQIDAEPTKQAESAKKAEPVKKSVTPMPVVASAS